MHARRPGGGGGGRRDSPVCAYAFRTRWSHSRQHRGVQRVTCNALHAGPSAGPSAGVTVALSVTERRFRMTPESGSAGSAWRQAVPVQAMESRDKTMLLLTSLHVCC
jgi:hypothetical protein